ncbi:MAG: gamma-glutamyl-gamma-aminobutyrate hydrolase family protein [Planctomycetota bacterium]|jgi:putative glutamine amidotransferase
MSKKPVIGINGDYRTARLEAGALSWFNAGYYDCITASKIQTAGNNKARNCPGGLPILIPPFVEEEDIEAVADMIDGLVLAGCHLDLDLERLGHDPHPAARPMPGRREDFDRRICELAVERRMPILAIGSGMQLLNSICGGTVYRHIPEDFEQPLQHRDPVEPNLRHLIEIEEESLLFDIYGPGEIRVNSQHHMAIDIIAPPFHVCARTVDGVVEAYESKEDDWFVMGVQWHPESDTASRLDMQIFEAFVQACEDRRNGQPFVLPFPTAQKAVA